MRSLATDGIGDEGGTCSPVKTSNVASPPLFPNCMSVLSLSPTMMVRLGSNLCLALGPTEYENEIISIIMQTGDTPHRCTQTKPGSAHFALMASNIRLLGFPIAVTGRLGPRPVTRGARMAPAPGSKPCSDGNVESSLVARNTHSGFECR
jgi:hypothetical protein